ncbi:S49 family peptidase [Gimesia chilikensis]|uniref:S49 family peptidase n=1 Tax=Gimesia chilikensis TaxID=2605989 RepID=UPI0011885405|nr:S49 family peptidase [Gimesia chilikensis]QDT84585.1 Putative signal peptide peptidase SppA [Gimesia chilikensis]
MGLDISMPPGEWMILPTAIDDTALMYQQFLQSLQNSEGAFFDDTDEHEETIDLSDCQIIENVAIVPLHGVMVRYPNWMTRWYGATSTDEYASKIEALADRGDIDCIIQDVNSPGGVVAGLDEAWERIEEVRKRISIKTVCNEMMASAAVYIGSCADETIVTRNGLAGSIGVIQERPDWSKYEAERGIETKVIVSGKYKAAFHPSVPFNADHQAILQNRSDRIYQTFLQVVAENRRTSVDNVLNNMADARIFTGQEAVEVGLADRVGTLRQLVAELTGPNNSQPFNYGDEDDGENYYARIIEH